MSKLAASCLCIFVAFLALSGSLRLGPVPVLAASATLSAATPLHDAPDPNAAVLAQLPEGTLVTIEGPPVDGFYPVMAGDLTGWIRGEPMVVEKEVADAAVDDGAPVDATGEVAVADQPPADAVASGAAATDPGVGGIGSGEVAPAESTEGASAASGEPLPPADPVDQAPAEPAAATPYDPAAVPAEGDTAAPVVEAESVPVAPNPVPDPGPTGPASVVADAPILAGPGPEFGLIATASAGGMVEQTGHEIDGYVTVQYADVTGWAPLDHLGPPGSIVAEPEPEEAPEAVKSRKKRRSR